MQVGLYKFLLLWPQFALWSIQNFFAQIFTKWCSHWHFKVAFFDKRLSFFQNFTILLMISPLCVLIANSTSFPPQPEIQSHCSRCIQIDVEFVNFFTQARFPKKEKICDILYSEQNFPPLPESHSGDALRPTCFQRHWKW